MLLGGAACILRAQTTLSPALLILAKRDTTMAIVDPTTLKVVARVPAGPDPHEVIASADGKLAFISNYGGGAYNTLSIVDLEAQKALPRFELGALRGPHGLDFAGGELYFTAEVNKVIGRYSPTAHKVDWILGTGQNRTHMVWVSKDLDRIYTSNVNSGTISIIEKVTGPAGAFGPPRSDWNETVVRVGGGSEGFDVSPDGKELWVGNAQDGTISIIDLASKKVVQTLDANVKGANRLKFTPDGSMVFVSSLAQGNLAVFNTASRQDAKRIPIGHGAGGILMQPNGSRAFVACSPDNYVAVIDLKTLEVTGRIEPGHDPDGMAWVTRP